MASNLKYAAALKNAQLDAITTALGSGALIKFYDGAQPASPAVAVSTQTLGATLTGASPFASGASGGVLTAGSITGANGVANITPTWFRIFTSGGTAMIDGTAGTSATDAILNAATITSGQPVSCSALTITKGN